MSSAVSVVVPSYDDRDCLAASLPRVARELERRGTGDELVVVDDGAGGLEEWLAAQVPRARCVERAENGGFAASVATGVAAARCELVFLMNPDVLVEPGVLEPLVRALEDPEVEAAAPWIRFVGEGAGEETLPRMAWRRGMPALEPVALNQREREGSAPLPAAFALGGASLWRREALLGDGAFDALFAPFYWEDVDRAWRAWRAGRRVVVCPDAVVEHRHRGTIGKAVPRGLVRAAIEKNRLLFAWRHVDDAARLAEHVDALRARLVRAAAREEREELVWLCLALEQLEEAVGGRSGDGGSTLGFEDARRVSDAGHPGGGAPRP